MNEFKVEGENIIVNVPYAEAYIPTDLFATDDIELDDGSVVSSVVAAYYGDGVRTVGLFNMRFFDSEENIDRNSKPLRTFNFPNTIDTYPTLGIEKMMLSIPADSSPESYTVLKYRRGDIMMPAKIKQNSDNCEKYLNMQLRGKIPSSIPYASLLQCWLTNLEINAFDPHVPAVTYQAALSELIRLKSNPTIQFRKVAGAKKDMGANDEYIAANTRSAVSCTSVFNALTFEDMNTMLTTSINMSRKGVKQNISPVEQILSM